VAHICLPLADVGLFVPNPSRKTGNNRRLTGLRPFSHFGKPVQKICSYESVLPLSTFVS